MELKERGKFFVAVSILVGTTIGAGVLGIPYVASKVGFFVALAYIIILGLIILTVNLYLGEVVLRTKKDHQIAGYAKKYFGNPGRVLTEFAVIFGVYSALVAYMLGIGDSLSFLFFNNTSYGIPFGVLTGLIMSGFLWGGLESLKKFEKFGVSIIILLFVSIFLVFVKDVRIENLIHADFVHIFLPFGVILFALTSFHAIPEINLVIKGNKKLMKKVLITGSFISMGLYAFFTFVVVGSQGIQTPEVATLALGTIFVFLGILTMFTSYLALGNAIDENFRIDDRMSRRRSWFFSALLPILIFIFIETVAGDFFSFTKVLGIGGIVSGGLIVIVSLLMAKKAKKYGDRKPEYSMPLNKSIIGAISLIFLLAVAREIFLVLS
jgi:amino acid permease